ncbi:MAG: patatin-like phospholipase family protein, partial [Pseudolysinimonas sp.]
MNNSFQNDSNTALVLGGGGAAGNAWLTGVVAGLADGGLDVTDADLIIGTSAGSTAAAQLTGAKPAVLFADILDAASQSPTGPARTGQATRSATNHMETTSDIIAAAADAADMRRRMGAWALATDAASPRSAQWRTTVAVRLASHVWPQQRNKLTKQIGVFF